jgi:hypothetical protein
MEYDIIMYVKVQVISKYKILNKNCRKSIINKVPGHFIIIQIKLARTDQRQHLYGKKVIYFLPLKLINSSVEATPTSFPVESQGSTPEVWILDPYHFNICSLPHFLSKGNQTPSHAIAFPVDYKSRGPFYHSHQSWLQSHATSLTGKISTKSLSIPSRRSLSRL